MWEKLPAMRMPAMKMFVVLALGLAPACVSNGTYNKKVAELTKQRQDEEATSKAQIDKLTKDLEDLCHRHIEVKTMEINRPEIDAQLVAEDIAMQLEKRASFRRTMKQAMQRAMEGGAKGVKLQLSGRLGGAEMARCEKGMEGSIPLSTLRARIEYGFAEARTAQGHIGIKVWINNGDYLDPSTDPALLPPGQQRPRRGGRRG